MTQGSFLNNNPLEHLFMGNMPKFTATAAGDPLVLARGEGIYLWDSSGKKYIDAIASLEAVAIGHGRREIADAITAQYAKLEFYDTLRYTSEPTVNLANKLAELSPMKGSRIHFATSGSEAVEAAIKLTRQFHVLNGDFLRTKLIARRGGYHGCTMGAMALDGNYYRTKRQLFEPVPYIGRFVPVPTTVDMIADLIEYERPETISAVFLDPMATASGVFPSDPKFWSDLRVLCDLHGVLLIADEVITAFGRTGKWFASDVSGIAPDLITVSKGLSSGYFPISAVIASGNVSDVFEASRAGFSHGHTFGGHPVAAVAAMANLAIIEGENLLANATTIGRHLRSQLEKLKDSNEIIREVRGEGLLFGVQLESPFPDTSNPEFGQKIIRKLREQGVLTFVLHPGNVLLLCPPLIITHDEVNDLVERLRNVLESILHKS
jgi:adenosylmethionine-8-amino-7-oxononanoate aminotransferase